MKLLLAATAGILVFTGGAASAEPVADTQAEKARAAGWEWGISNSSGVNIRSTPEVAGGNVAGQLNAGNRILVGGRVIGGHYGPTCGAPSSGNLWFEVNHYGTLRYVAEACLDVT